MSDPQTDTEIATGTTSATDGTYDLNVPDTANFDGPFVKVTVTGGSGALMICDAGEGCQTPSGDPVDFGDTFPIDSSVMLSAIALTPADGGSETINITVFSDLAASLAEAASGSLSETVINDANAQVSNLFGLTSADLTGLAALNLADDTTTSGDDNALRAAVVSGGVLSAAFENGPDIGAALAALRADFAGNGGQLVVNESVDDPALISLEDILVGAVEAGDRSEINTESFGRSRAEILGESISASAAEAGIRSTANVAPSNNAPALDKAKAFVSDLQLIIAAVQQDANEDSFVDFADRIEAAGRLLEDDAESALETVLKASRAITEAYNLYQDDTSLTSVTSEGFVVDISSPNGVVTYNIAPQIVDGNTVQITVSGDIDVEIVESEEFSESKDFTNRTGSEETIITIGGSESYSGSVENEAIKIEILNGEVSVRNGNARTGSNYQYLSRPSSFETRNEESVLVEAEMASAQLEIIATQKSQDGLAFEGVAKAALVAPSFKNELVSIYQNDNNIQSVVDVTSQAAGVKAADIGFSGKLSEGEEFINVSLAVDLEANKFVLSNEVEPVILTPYSVTGNVLVVGGPPTIITHSLITFEQMKSEVVALIDTGSTGLTVEEFEQLLQDDSLSRTRFLSESGGVIGGLGADNEQELVYRFNQSNSETGITFTVFWQADTIGFFDNEMRSQEFQANPPTNIVDYFNFGLEGEDESSIVCINERQQYFLRPTRFVDATKNGFEDIPLRQLSGPPPCSFDSNDFLVLESGNEIGFDPEATASALVAASIKQNIAGIDPNDSLVKASVFGPINYTEDEVSGNLTVKLEFAGRTFQSDARSVDILDDISEPVTITNQDGVMMVISENAQGLATGSVTLDGEELGVITEENGIILVTYTDDTFVSLQ